jgi:hypothetical protein
MSKKDFLNTRFVILRTVVGFFLFYGFANSTPRSFDCDARYELEHAWVWNLIFPVAYEATNKILLVLTYDVLN